MWPARLALQQVASPEKRVGVHVGDQQRAVQRLGLGGNVVWTRLQRMVLLPLQDGWTNQARHNQ